MNGDLNANQKAAREQRFREGLRLHEIEGNPLDDEDIAMFEMFEREGWSHDKRHRPLALAAAKDAQASS